MNNDVATKTANIGWVGVPGARSSASPVTYGGFTIDTDLEDFEYYPYPRVYHQPSIMKNTGTITKDNEWDV